MPTTRVQLQRSVCSEGRGCRRREYSRNAAGIEEDDSADDGSTDVRNTACIAEDNSADDGSTDVTNTACTAEDDGADDGSTVTLATLIRAPIHHQPLSYDRQTFGVTIGQLCPDGTRHALNIGHCSKTKSA